MRIQVQTAALLLGAALAGDPSFAQARSSSPEVGPDRRATFTLRAPNAKSVILKGVGSHPMTRDADGDWSVTIGPLSPGIYSYTYDVDGAAVIDPRNRDVKKWFTLNSLLEISGNPPRLWELQETPHGVVHQSFPVGP